MKPQFLTLLTLCVAVDVSVALAPRTPMPVPGSRPQARVPDSMTNGERLARGLPPRAPKALFDSLSEFVDPLRRCINLEPQWRPRHRRVSGVSEMEMEMGMETGMGTATAMAMAMAMVVAITGRRQPLKDWIRFTQEATAFVDAVGVVSKR
ncbi:hypothetical protein EV360DRAFT_90201 [Lentinula raphanica]|nr:hypothetical protein EV360DRAFT_90201 [Lentinula raphanica]